MDAHERVDESRCVYEVRPQEVVSEAAVAGVHLIMGLLEGKGIEMRLDANQRRTLQAPAFIQKYRSCVSIHAGSDSSVTVNFRRPSLSFHGQCVAVAQTGKQPVVFRGFQWNRDHRIHAYCADACGQTCRVRQFRHDQLPPAFIPISFHGRAIAANLQRGLLEASLLQPDHDLFDCCSI